MTLIITGGAGFIGSNHVFYVLEKYPDCKVVCFDALTYAGRIETLESVMKDPRLVFVRGDIADRDTVYACFEEHKPDVVINFAAESHMICSYEVSSKDYSRNKIMR